MNVEQKALELVNAVRTERGMSHDNCINRAIDYDEALCRALEAHEADKQRHAAEMRERAERFSEFAQLVAEVYPDNGTLQTLARPFILAPVDPLVEALADLGLEKADEWAPDIRKAMAARGLAIVKKEAVNG